MKDINVFLLIIKWEKYSLELKYTLKNTDSEKRTSSQLGNAISEAICKHTIWEKAFCLLIFIKVLLCAEGFARMLRGTLCELLQWWPCLPYWGFITAISSSSPQINAFIPVTFYLIFNHFSPRFLFALLIVFRSGSLWFWDRVSCSL